MSLGNVGTVMRNGNNFRKLSLQKENFLEWRAVRNLCLSLNCGIIVNKCEVKYLIDGAVLNTRYSLIINRNWSRNNSFISSFRKGDF